MSFLAWPVIAVWMGLGIIIGVGAIAALTWVGAHLAHDAFVGSDGDIWCPVHKTMYHAHGTPRAWRNQPAFTELWRCQPFGAGEVTCAKKCLRAMPVPGAAPGVAVS